MFTELVMRPFIEWILRVGNDVLYPVMILTFFGAVALRFLIYWTVRRHAWFAYELEKRVNRFLDSDDRAEKRSFFMVSKRLLERTFYEIFETRDRLKRRTPDKIMSFNDRLFMIRPGAAWIVRDIMKQLRNFKWGEQPNFLNVTKTVFAKNPYFNRVCGLVSASGLNDILNILPGMFVIAGIFGTFIGIMQGLPTLGNMDLNDIEKTKSTMDVFLVKIAFSMGTSVLGIIFSVVLNVLNTMFSPEKTFVGVVDRFENSLILLWQRCDNNDVPRDGMVFDENRDAVEALAEAALNQEIAKRKGDRDADVAMKKEQKQAS